MNNHQQNILMQYQTPLPDDFDISSISQRIAQVSRPFDQMPGLIFKLYCVNENSTAALNEYSSIYLWADPAAMQRFLVSELFTNYVEAFTRPSVRVYLVDGWRANLAKIKKARCATRRILPFPRQLEVRQTLRSWAERLRQPEALLQLAAFDPATWEYFDLTVWDQEREAQDSSHIYQVAHVSSPGF